jgi:hypothetical protein
MKLEDIIKLKLNNYEVKLPKEEMIEPNPCWEGYEPYGTKIVDGREVPNCVPTKEGMKKIVKEGFPIPSPSSDEDEQTYISRCNKELYGEFPDDAQRNAVCYAQWEKK